MAIKVDSRSRKAVGSNITRSSYGGMELDCSDAILATYPGTRPETPEMALSIATLKDAISLLTRTSIPDTDLEDYNLTIKWLHGQYESSPGWSFEEIADRLQVDVGALRKGILDFAGRNKGRALKGVFIRTSTSQLVGD